MRIGSSRGEPRNCYTNANVTPMSVGHRVSGGECV